MYMLAYRCSPSAALPVAALHNPININLYSVYTWFTTELYNIAKSLYEYVISLIVTHVRTAKGTGCRNCEKTGRAYLRHGRGHPPFICKQEKREKIPSKGYRYLDPKDEVCWIPPVIHPLILQFFANDYRVISGSMTLRPSSIKVRFHSKYVHSGLKLVKHL